MASSSSFLLLISSLLFTLFLLLHPPPAAAILDHLPPFLSPLLNGCEAIECGKGQCKESSNHTFGFVCECEEGWKQLHIEDHFRFMPCVIPNCSIDLSCAKVGSIPSTPPLPTDQSIFNPCDWAYCGEGSCAKTTLFKHRCICNQGYTNLLNLTYFPCFSKCVLGGNCPNLDIGLLNPSVTSSPPYLPDSSSLTIQGEAKLRWKIFCWVLLMIPLDMLPWI